MVDPTLVQNSVFNQPKLDAPTMAEAYDGLLIAAFLGPDRRILSVHQHPRSQQKEVAVVAGADTKLRMYFVYYTLHCNSPQRDNIERPSDRQSQVQKLQPLPLMPGSN